MKKPAPKNLERIKRIEFLKFRMALRKKFEGLYMDQVVFMTGKRPKHLFEKDKSGNYLNYETAKVWGFFCSGATL